LKQEGVSRLFVGGLALDVCVLHSVMDGLKEGFRVSVIEAATRPVRPGTAGKAIRKMKTAGAEIF
jgi:nicotinamidase/pyrazinamidase